MHLLRSSNTIVHPFNEFYTISRLVYRLGKFKQSVIKLSFIRIITGFDEMLAQNALEYEWMASLLAELAAIDS